jgi:ketosteroid isomerase-like protein
VGYKAGNASVPELPMSTFRVFSIAAVSLIAAAALANPSNPAVPADLAARVRAYDVAQVKGDKAALEDLLADDFVLVNSSGQRQTKAQLIADYTKPGFKLEPFVVEEAVEIFWSDGAVMGGVARIRGVDGGQPYDLRLRFSDIWAKRDGKWRVVYVHASRDPAG